MAKSPTGRMRVMGGVAAALLTEVHHQSSISEDHDYIPGVADVLKRVTVNYYQIDRVFQFDRSDMFRSQDFGCLACRCFERLLGREPGFYQQFHFPMDARAEKNTWHSRIGSDYDTATGRMKLSDTLAQLFQDRRRESYLCDSQGWRDRWNTTLKMRDF
jgi:hypothetical protein